MIHGIVLANILHCLPIMTQSVKMRIFFVSVCVCVLCVHHFLCVYACARMGVSVLP